MMLVLILIAIIIAQSVALFFAAIQLENTSAVLSTSNDLLKRQSYENFIAKHGNPWNMSYEQYWNCGGMGGSRFAAHGNNVWVYEETRCGDDGEIRPVTEATATGKYLDFVESNGTLTITYIEDGSIYRERFNNTTFAGFEQQGYSMVGEPVKLKTFGSGMAYLYEAKMVKDTKT